MNSGQLISYVFKTIYRERFLAQYEILGYEYESLVF